MKKNKHLKIPIYLGITLVIFAVVFSLFYFFITPTKYHPNLYRGVVTLREFSTNENFGDSMKACADPVTSKNHIVSEGSVTANSEIISGALKFMFSLGNGAVEDMKSSAVHKATVDIFNFESGKWENIFNMEGVGNNIEYTYDIGETLPRNGVVTTPKQCTSYAYRNYQKTSCSYFDYNFTADNINPADYKSVKLRLDMYVEGGNTDRSNCVNVYGVNADFTYANCPDVKSEKPCEKATSIGYPTCNWDNSECGIALWKILVVVGLVITIILVAVFTRVLSKKRRKR